MRIKAIRFEPGTITPGTNPKRLDVVSGDQALMSTDAAGVCLVFPTETYGVPWHRVHCIELDRESASDPASMPLDDMRTEIAGLADQHAVLEAQKRSALLGGKAASVAVANDMRRQVAKKKGQS